MHTPGRGPIGQAVWIADLKIDGLMTGTRSPPLDPHNSLPTS